MNRGSQVNNPASIVLVDNISNGIVSLNRDDGRTVLLKPGETGQLTWAEFVRAKNIPHFGRFIKLNDSVVISDGSVKIKNITTDLSEDYLIDLLVQNVDRLKEFSMTLNDGEKEIFKAFLKQRNKIGIEVEKCSALLDFMDTDYNAEDSEEVVEANEEKPKRGRPKKGKKLDNAHVIHESDSGLSAHIERTEDSE